MRRNALLGLLFLSTVAQSVAAESTVRVLLPIVSAPVPGANGALWETELWFRNNAATPVHIGPLSGASETPFGRGTFRLEVARPPASQPPGLFVQVTGDAPQEVQFSTTVRDVARTMTWGASIPAVREDEFSASRCVLMNVPRTAALRHTLRIYEASGAPGLHVRVRVYPLTGETPLAETVMELQAREPAWAYPGYAQITALTDAFPALAGEGAPLRIEVEPLDPAMRIWAFVSVTSNAANHITIVTPR